MEKLGWAILGLFIIILCLIFAFGVIGGVVYICALTFGFEFSWMLVLGVCAIIILIRYLLK